MWEISKEFACCYGHRVYNQLLNTDYCGNDNKAKCRHIHGHEGLVRVHLSGTELTDRGMITDFKHLGWFKDFIDNSIDHKFIIDKNDPMFTALVADPYTVSSGQPDITYDSVTVVDSTLSELVVGKTLRLNNIPLGTPVYEVLEGYFIVNFVPTSENLAKWLFDIISFKMKPLEIKVSCVEFHETPKSCARYYGPTV